MISASQSSLMRGASETLSARPWSRYETVSTVLDISLNLVKGSEVKKRNFARKQ
jgi:hypothetical protein